MNAPAREKQRVRPQAGRADCGMAATSPFAAAGLQITSLIDYPGKVSCVVFLTGCNFTCPFCHNPDLALGRLPRKIELTELYSFLDQRRSFLDGVVISGGEPTLQTGLEDLCQNLRDRGFSVKLDTNGSRPEVLKTLLDEQLVDYIAMDIKTAPDRYGPPLCPDHVAPAIRRSIRLIMQNAGDYEFRTTCLLPFTDKDSISAIARTIKGAKRYVLQRFRPANVLSPGYFNWEAAVLTEEQLTTRQQIAAPWVETCLVR